MSAVLKDAAPGEAQAQQRTLSLSIGGKHNARVLKTWRGSFEQFCSALLAKVPQTEDKASAGWVCGAEFEATTITDSHGRSWTGPYRDSQYFGARHLLSLDYDHITEEQLGEIVAFFKPVAHLAYTTHSHMQICKAQPKDCALTGTRHPRLRVWVPLSRPVGFHEFQAVARKVAAELDIEWAARESFTPCQYMYRPATRAGEKFQHWENTTGPFLDVDQVLGQYADWTDRSQWPHRAEGDAVHGEDEGADPRTKPDPIGAFCRAFTVPDAITRFELPYAPSGTEGRFTYTNGSRADGGRLYDEDTKFHSENDTDPARGQHSAYDLVRIHRFGKLDADAAPGAPFAELPSNKAMKRFALELPEVQAEMTPVEEFASLDDEGSPTDSNDEKKPVLGDLKLCSLGEVLSRKSRVRWLPGLKGKLEREVQAVMAGPRGSYKSFVVTDWAMRTAVAGSTVLILSAEGAGMDRRLEVWLKERAPDVDPATFKNLFVLQQRLDLNDIESRKAVHALLAAQKVRPDLIVIDTYSKYTSIDEDSNTETKNFLRAMAKFAASARATILYVAHTGHQDKSRARGASALEADTDCAFVVSKLPDKVSIRVTRERFKDSPELPPLEYARRIVDLERFDEDGDLVTSIILDESEDKLEAKMPEGKNEQALWLELRAHPAGILREELIQGAKKRVERGKGKEDKRRDNLTRALRGMLAKKIVRVERDMVFFASEFDDLDEGTYNNPATDASPKASPLPESAPAASEMATNKSAEPAPAVDDALDTSWINEEPATPTPAAVPTPQQLLMQQLGIDNDTANHFVEQNLSTVEEIARAQQFSVRGYGEGFLRDLQNRAREIVGN